MELELTLSFTLSSILLSLMPGPDNIFVLTESVTKGYKNGIAIAFGLCVGILLHTFAAATGLSLIIQQSVFVFTAIKYFGAAYLFYLAYLGFRENNTSLNLESMQKAARLKVLPLIKQGFLMNILNPKVSLFFIAFLPHFISPAGFDVMFQMMILGFIFMLQALFIFSSIALLAGKLTEYISNSRFWTITRWSKIIILALLGLALVLTEN